jgi:hypothetical protein
MMEAPAHHAEDPIADIFTGFEWIQSDEGEGEGGGLGVDPGQGCQDVVSPVRVRSGFVVEGVADC